MGWISDVTNSVKKVVKKAAPILGGGLGLATGGLGGAALGFGAGGLVSNLLGSNDDPYADAQSRELENWYKQQEYNSPANQVARLKAAGLNPNLFYSMGNVGNASSAPSTIVNKNQQDKMEQFQGLLGQSFNALQLLSSVRNAETENAQKIAQIEHSKDVLNFQREQAAVNNAFRAQQMAYNQSRDEREQKRWFDNFNETVRHHQAMEGRPTTMGMLDALSLGLTGQHTTDVMSDTAGALGDLSRKYYRTLFTLTGVPKLHARFK